MAVDQRKLVSVMRSAVSMSVDRYDGYQEDLFDHLSQIIMLEREHLHQATQIQKKISDKIEALGKLITKHGGFG